LHYFPQTSSSSNWCGWHNDHGAITGLTSSLYIDENTGKLFSASELPSSTAGLFIRSRKGEPLKVCAAADALCFQIGETAQILSGGTLQATPHAVLSKSGVETLSRNTFAVFMEPRGYFPLRSHDPESVFVEHEGVPSLRARWQQGLTFRDFHLRTLAHFN
jgi:isopenicillin N synthase-like dioxygenase